MNGNGRAHDRRHMIPDPIIRVKVLNELERFHPQDINAEEVEELVGSIVEMIQPEITGLQQAHKITGYVVGYSCTTYLMDNHEPVRIYRLVMADGTEHAIFHSTKTSKKSVLEIE